MKKEKIIGSLDGKSEEEVEKDMLEKFGFVKITEFMSRGDGSIVADNSLSGTYEIDCELFIDYKNKRALLYSFGWDLHLLDGELTKKEEKNYYDKK